jgi:hypothetical protein
MIGCHVKVIVTDLEVSDKRTAPVFKQDRIGGDVRSHIIYPQGAARTAVKKIAIKLHLLAGGAGCGRKKIKIILGICPGNRE